MKSLFLSMFFFLSPIALMAQIPMSLKLPQVSPLEEKSITIGLTEISLEYSSVGMRGREIWGDFIPFGEVWRTGANKNTIFTVEDDVLINGESLVAGSYGFHTIPGEEEWVLIFSSNAEAWGSYFYDESEDVLRITVPVTKTEESNEWMAFSYDNYTSSTVDVVFQWASRKIVFTVEVPMEVTIEHIKRQFTSLPAFSWQGWQQGANYLLSNNSELETALAWAKESVRREANPQTLNTLARLQLKNELADDAMKTVEQIAEWTDNWRANYWAGEIYEIAGDKKKAITAFQKAHDLVSNSNRKAMIMARIKALK